MHGYDFFSFRHVAKLHHRCDMVYKIHMHGYDFFNFRHVAKLHHRCDMVYKISDPIEYHFP
jgi:hypothetical protein